MKKNHSRLAILAFGLVLVVGGKSAQAFLPPIQGILFDLFETRKGNLATEVMFRHKISVREGETVEIEERAVNERGRMYFLWRPIGQTASQAVASIWEGSNYQISKERGFPLRSQLFIKYFFSNSADDFRDTLLSENFLRRDQLFQFKPGFIPAGDPQTWDLKNNYIRHDDIFLTRLPQGISITVVGVNTEKMRRVAYFDRRGRGLNRLEWKDGTQEVAWNMESFSKTANGSLPRRLSFELGGVQIIGSEVMLVRQLKDKSLFDFKTAWKQAARSLALSAPVEAGLKVLLSYR